MKLIDEIGIEYANANGGGLPLTAKEYCNALALWVKDQLRKEAPSLEEVFNLLTSTDTITLYNNGQKIEIHLNAEVLADIERSLKFPVSRPTETELVGVDELGQQVMIPQSQVGGGGKLYKHNVSFKGTSDDAYFFSYISSNPNPTQLPDSGVDYMDTNPQAKGSIITKMVNKGSIHDEVDTNFPLSVFYSFGENQYEIMSYGSVVQEIDLVVNLSTGSWQDIVTEL